MHNRKRKREEEVIHKCADDMKKRLKLKIPGYTEKMDIYGFRYAA